MIIELYAGEDKYLATIDTDQQGIKSALTGPIFREFVNQTFAKYSLRCGGETLAEGWYDSGTAHEDGESWEEIVDQLLEDADL
jgi:hypothetical protein